MNKDRDEKTKLHCMRHIYIWRKKESSSTASKATSYLSITFYKSWVDLDDQAKETNQLVDYYMIDIYSQDTHTHTLKKTSKLSKRKAQTHKPDDDN